MLPKLYVSGIDLLGEETQAVVKAPVNTAIQKMKEADVRWTDFALPVASAVAGYFVGKKRRHPVLGVLGGLSVGSSAAKVVKGQYADAVAPLIGGAGGVQPARMAAAHVTRVTSCQSS